MRSIFAFSLSFVLLCLAGCTAGVTRPNNEPLSSKAPLSDPAIVTLTLSDNARKQIGENLKFDQAKLLETLNRAFDSKGLLAKDSTSAARHVEIQVTDVRVRGTFSAIMWGFMAGNDHLNGTVTLSDGESRPLRHFDVSAAYALGGLGGGQDGARLGWLYEKFTEETVNELTGVGKPAGGSAAATGK